MPSQRCKEAYHKLALESRKNIFSWMMMARRIDQGKNVVLNILYESHMNMNLFTNFLNLIASHYRDNVDSGIIDISEIVKHSYESACIDIYNLHGINLCCQGAQSIVNTNTLLHRITKLETFQKMISEAMGGSGDGSEPQKAWEDFLELQKNKPDLFKELLKKITPCKIDRINWTYFNENQQDIDPLSHLSEEDCLDTLGLPEIWFERGLGKYNPKAPWRIHYRPKDHITMHIPSLADTFYHHWNPHFKVSTDIRWGWTRPLTQGREGVPEIVHRGWKQGTKPNVMIGQFEFIGD